ncbi:hypothetical protein [Laspinema olomoucense]|uniref:hypothetical protein n=1 Tax=Laspinema olomoucense TaxID=3231600 RepID=UPI0021BA424C|nr:hypothetical protein [Laspinema sp. D3c]MCT7992490.1 hypothetical protein [Laspinema sp. D3c]
MQIIYYQEDNIHPMPSFNLPLSQVQYILGVYKIVKRKSCLDERFKESYNRLTQAMKGLGDGFYKQSYSFEEQQQFNEIIALCKSIELEHDFKALPFDPTT